jgi:hypothetical protein
MQHGIKKELDLEMSAVQSLVVTMVSGRIENLLYLIISVNYDVEIKSI